MATISPVPKLQFSDENGVPLAAGLLYTYEAGTTTPKTTYQDAAQVAANANPIVLDASGQANVWLTPGEAYKFVLQNALATGIWTVDNITAAGTLSLQSATNVAITGGTIAGVAITGSTFSGTASNVSGIVGIANGGTGEDTADTARAALGAAESGDNTDIASLTYGVTIGGEAIGYLGIPSIVATGAYVVVATTNGVCVDITTGGVTIPANATLALPNGFTFSVFNNSGSSQSIAITTDTMRLAGTASTGTRSLAQYGWATVRKVSSTVWVISGAGLT